MDKKRFFSLFLMVILPIHVWSLVVSFNNLQTVIHRSTSVFDGIGYTAYALLQALLEGTALFLLLAVLSYLLPKKWPVDLKRVQLVMLGWVVFFWAAFAQLYKYWLVNWLKSAIDYFLLWLSYRKAFNPVVLVLIFVVLLASVIVPAWLVWRKPRVRTWCLGLFDRLSILSILYLALDFAALFVILYRNLWVLI
jgi:hypothetical protein